MVLSSIALVFGILLSLSSAADDYTKTSDCQVVGLMLMILHIYSFTFLQEKHTCVYEYTASSDLRNKEGKERATISTTVYLTCESGWNTHSLIAINSGPAYIHYLL